MRCPWCGNDEDKVVDARPGGETIRRRRQCLSCGRRYTAFEQVEARPSRLARRHEGAWDREKMVAGVRKAIVNRPVSEEQVAKLADTSRAGCGARQ